MTVNSGTVSMSLADSYTLDFDALDMGTELPLPAITDLTFDLDVSLTQSTGVDAMGVATTLDSPVTFAGVLMFDIDPVAVAGSVS